MGFVKEFKEFAEQMAIPRAVGNVKSMEDAKASGRVLTELARNTAHRQFECNHCKGGTYTQKMVFGSDGISRREMVFPTKGQSPYYAVIKHQMIHGDIWVRCLRCGKWWKPPLRKDHKDDRSFWRAMFEYEEALNFKTNNTASGSVQCRFETISPDGSRKDETEIVREKMANAAGY